MNRKWSNIDLNRVSKYETRRLDSIKVIELSNAGLSRDDICENLNLSYGKVCSTF